MKRILFYSVIFFLFSCKKEDNAVFRNPQKGDIYINEIVSLEGNISYNVNPDANPNLVMMSGIHNEKTAEEELYKQPFFNGYEVDIRKFDSNTKANVTYYLDDKKTIKFVPISDNKNLIKIKVQRKNETAILIPYVEEPIVGLSILDLNKDGIKDILLFTHSYAVNNDFYDMKVFSIVKK